MVVRLLENVEELNIRSGIRNALAGKVRSASRRLKAGDTREFANVLGAFANQVRAQGGKVLSPAAANELLAVGLGKTESANPAESAAWISVARILLNLHETITRF